MPTYRMQVRTTVVEYRTYTVIAPDLGSAERIAIANDIDCDTPPEEITVTDREAYEA